LFDDVRFPGELIVPFAFCEPIDEERRQDETEDAHH